MRMSAGHEYTMMPQTEPVGVAFPATRYTVRRKLRYIYGNYDANEPPGLVGSQAINASLCLWHFASLPRVKELTVSRCSHLLDCGRHNRLCTESY